LPYYVNFLLHCALSQFARVETSSVPCSTPAGKRLELQVFHLQQFCLLLARHLVKVRHLALSLRPRRRSY
ncbi:MAG: hypothetical protein PHC51_12775, partial [bacterium]|nr:hypothetical protein [bacterium]